VSRTDEEYRIWGVTERAGFECNDVVAGLVFS